MFPLATVVQERVLLSRIENLCFHQESLVFLSPDHNCLLHPECLPEAQLGASPQHRRLMVYKRFHLAVEI